MKRYVKIILLANLMTLFLLGTALAGGVANAMPEPLSMVLLGTGFIIFAGFGRKRLKKK